jgi:hypothetical protein
MVDATWNGGNGNYTDPNNWSGGGVPDKPGDLGIVTNGTIQLDKLDLTGVGTQISSQSNANPATLDVRNSTLGVLPITELTPSLFLIADVNTQSKVTLANYMQLGGGIEGFNFGSTLNLDIGGGRFTNAGTIDEQTFSTLNIAGNGKFANDGTVDITGANATLDTAVVGTGVINEQIGIDTHASFLEFGAKVGAGQTINLDGTQLILDDAKQFKGLIVFAEPPPPPAIGREQVELKGIAATSSSYGGGVLDVFVGSHVAAALRITANDPQVTSSGGNTFLTTT